MRVSSGFARGKNLKVPKIPGVRVSQEIVRQAIFSILSERILNTICLDLYAGSGSIGIEALSKGATWCDFVDINPEATQTIKENLKATSFDLNSRVFTQDSLKYVGNCGKSYDLIFMDPYYDQAVHKHIFKTLPMILKKEGILIFLHGKDIKIEDLLLNSSFSLRETRKYGASYVTFLILKS